MILARNEVKIFTTVFKSNTAKSFIEKRLTGRRTCKKCGEPYHVKFLPPKKDGACDRCGGELMQRSDDTEEVAKRRLQVFHTQNEGILAYYRQKDNLKEIDANRSRDEIQDDLVKTLKP